MANTISRTSLSTASLTSVLTAAMLSMGCAAGIAAPTESAHEVVGQAAPELPQEAATDVAATAGKIGIVVFFDRSSIEQDEALDIYGRLAQSLPKDVAVIGVSHEPALVEKTSQKAYRSFSVLSDVDGRLARRYGAQPGTTYVIDRAGKVRSAHSGFGAVAREELLDEVGSLVAR